MDSITGIVVEKKKNVLKHSCIQVFTTDEMFKSSPTSKRAIKATDNMKPSLDLLKFDLLQRVIHNKSSFYKKFENHQKVLRVAKKRE